MEWIRFEGIERFYAARQVLAGASGVIRDGDKIGLIGVNGSGKSTLMRILAGVDAPDGGTVTRARKARIGYIRQETAADAQTSLGEVMESAFAMVRAEERALRNLEAAIAAAAGRADADAEQTLLRKYSAAREEHERHGGDGFERRMRSMLAGFGLSAVDLDRPMSELSGGQRTRASIARVLLEDPDVLLLDEPTNHLDVEATRILENLIARDSRAHLIVSHDRYVLDRVATEIWELADGKIARYPTVRGTPAYTAFVDERRRRDAEAQRLYELYVAERDRRRAVIAELRTHGSHNYSQVRSREKLLEKFDAPTKAPRAGKKVAIRLDSSRPVSRGTALSIAGMTKAYRQGLFSNLEFEVARGERIAVVGPNGSGKSTLLSIIAGKTNADAGTVRFASGVKPVYFSQEAVAELTPGARAVDAVMEVPGLTPQTARALLGRVGLGGEHADKPVESFSGGERRRIMLARLMARDSDCLLLDEPTNDLDIASREVLEEALDAYAGTMIVVSHDRYLLHKLADRVLWLRGGQWSLFGFGYEEYEEMLRSGGATRVAVVQTPAAPTRDQPQEDTGGPVVVLSKNMRAALERELADCEAEIDRLDVQRAELEREYGDPELYCDPKRVKSVHAQLESVRDAIRRKTDRWEDLVNTLHAAVP